MGINVLQSTPPAPLVVSRQHLTQLGGRLLIGVGAPVWRFSRGGQFIHGHRLRYELPGLLDNDKRLKR